MYNASVIRAFTIIEYLAQCDDSVGPRTLARELGINPTTALRFLNSLKQLGYVHQDANSGYYLTLKFAWLGAKLLDKIQLRAVAFPHLEHLRTATNETTHLAILEGTEIVYIAKLDAHQPMQMRSQVGRRSHIHSTALGRAILAHMSDAEVEALLPTLDMPMMTNNTITDLDSFRSELRRVRERGYTIDNEENEKGIRCIGAPVFDHQGHVAGAVSLSGWTISMTTERAEALAAEVLKTCAAISHGLGYENGVSDNSR